ncbi:hypothetical protein [Deinococcus ficus]|uniref:hypothetical protein n=1 Tax=Deinococcus ficus TaxID=317577 RepID=UPI000415848C|nr:hypothetical protein [Deinococcus ficus]
MNVTIIGKLKNIDGSPVTNGAVRFTLQDVGYEFTDFYTTQPVTAATDATGSFSASVWSNLQSGKKAPYKVEFIQAGEIIGTYTAYVPNDNDTYGLNQIIEGTGVLTGDNSINFITYRELVGGLGDRFITLDQKAEEMDAIILVGNQELAALQAMHQSKEAALDASIAAANQAAANANAYVGSVDLTPYLKTVDANAAFAGISHGHSFSSLSDKPTTLAGYGITDAYTKGQTDTLLSTHTHAFNSLTGLPTTLAGYGVTDAYSKTEVDAKLAAAGTSNFSGSFTDLTNKPTTLAGYGVTDAYTKTEVDTALSNKADATHNHDAAYLKLSGGVMSGSLTSVNTFPLISTNTAAKSWTLHNSNANMFVIAPSATNNGTDWDWSKQVYINANDGAMYVEGGKRVSTTDHTHAFSAITDKPNTVAGYGITDAYTKTEVDSKRDTLKNYVLSRGMNLLTNGFAMTGDKTNFSQFTYYPQDVFAGQASFLDPVAYNNIMLDELIAVNPNKSYRFDFAAKAINYVPGGSYTYAYSMSYDIDGNVIDPWHYTYTPESVTTLTQPLAPTDTVVHVSSVAGFTGHFYRWLKIHKYRNAKGYLWGEKTYSRNVKLSLTGDYATYQDSGVDATNKTITLTTPWGVPNPDDPNGVWPAGTVISHTYPSSSYQYFAMVNYPITNEWVSYGGVIGTTSKDGGVADVQFPYGTAYIKLGFLTNRTPNGVPDPAYAGNTTAFSALSFTEMTVENFTGGTKPQQAEVIKNIEGLAFHFKNGIMVNTVGEYSLLGKTLKGKLGTFPEDERDAPTTPNMHNRTLSYTFKTHGALGLDDGGFWQYSGVIGGRAWQDASGGKAFELATTDNGNLWVRFGSTDTWEAWKKIAHSENTYNKTEVDTKLQVKRVRGNFVSQTRLSTAPEYHYNLPVDSISENVGSWTNNSFGVITPEAGFYNILIHLRFTVPATSVVEVVLDVDWGTGYKLHESTYAAGTHTITLNAANYYNAGQRIGIAYHANTDITIAANPDSYYRVFRVGG